jgi:hypothetical protein
MGGDDGKPFAEAGNADGAEQRYQGGVRWPTGAGLRQNLAPHCRGNSGQEQELKPPPRPAEYYIRFLINPKQRRAWS